MSASQPSLKSIAIVGGGISGLAGAFYLEKARRAGAPLTYTVFEGTGKLGGILQTDREAGFVVEAGADSWLNQKPWAKELALEAGLEDQIIPSLDRQRVTYILSNSTLLPMPVGMQLVVPTQPSAVLASALFSPQTKARVLQEQNIQPASLECRVEDESVSSFVARHFGPEMVEKIAEPLLAGVFGGDASRLSAHAVLPGLIALEQEYGSLIRGASETASKAPAAAGSVFVSLRSGMQRLPLAVAGKLPASAVVRNTKVQEIRRTERGWIVATPGAESIFDELVLAVPARTAAKLLANIDANLGSLLELRYSSCTVVALGFEPDRARQITLPPGFGFLVPRSENRSLMACTFVHQKFASRTPEGCALLRAFIGEPVCDLIRNDSDRTVVRKVRQELQEILNFEVEPSIARVQRWPNSLPQYEVGHLGRVAKIESHVANLRGLQLVGNGYNGIGVPDCVRGAKIAAEAIIERLGK